MLHVRPATAADMPTIIGFIDEAAGWLALKGTDQWASPWPSRPERDERVRRGIRDHCTWMVDDDGVPVATISCRPAGNPHLWQEPEQHEPAVYVSRLMVSRSHGGEGIGHELFDWAGWWAAEQYGAEWIRIDVWTTNEMLHDYYAKRGFSFIRICDYAGYPSAALFQKPTNEITAADLPRLREVPRLQRPAGWGPSTPLIGSAELRSARRWLRRHDRPARRLAGVAALHTGLAVAHGGLAMLHAVARPARARRRGRRPKAP
ncbi:MAG TPA: GNAT family N-acetyltransferase [Streptosporangiaceae bacterium]